MPAPLRGNTLDSLAAQIAALDAKVDGLVASSTGIAAQITSLRDALLASTVGALPSLAAQIDGVSDQIANLGTITPPPPNGNGNPPPPPSSGIYTDQAYPLTMTPVAHNWDPVTIGVGPNALMLTMRGYPGSSPNSMAVVLDNTVIAAPLTVTGGADELGGDQVFTIRGTWGPPPHVVKIMSGGQFHQLSSLSVMSMTFDYLPLAYTGPTLDARGSGTVVGQTTMWDNIGIPMIAWYIPPDTSGQPPPPPPNTNPTNIVGAAINGAGQAPMTLDALVAATPTGSTLSLPAGTWAGVSGIDLPIIIAGAVSSGKTIIDASGMALASGKGILSPNIPGVTFRNLTLRGAAVSDGNGAAIREGGNGCDWSASDVEITGCQDGILTFSSNITLTRCNIHDNGAHDGLSHECYINGSPTTTATLTDNTHKCGTNSTHALKSRAGTTRISGGHYTGNPGAESNDVTGAVLNFPNCGTVTIDGATIELMSNGSDPNTQFLTYGTESLANQPTGMSVTLTNVRVIDHSGSGGSFQVGGVATGQPHLVIGAGCTYAGPTAPSFSGWASVTGAFTQAA